MEPIELATLGGYAIVLLVIGGWFVGRQESSEGFLLADRTLGTLTVFAGTFSTFYGPGIIFTFAAVAYLYGVGAFALPLAAVIGFLPLALAAPRIKRLSDRTSAITLHALLRERWSARTRVLAALVTGGLFAAALVVNLRLAGVVLETLVGVPLRAGIVGFGVLVVAYTALGGFRAVVWTDIVQLLLIVVSVLMVLPVIVLSEADPGILGRVPDAHLDPRTLPAPIVTVYLLVGVFTFFGSQDLFQRIYAARGEREARGGFLLFTAALGVVGVGAVALGIAARAIVPSVDPDAALLALTNDVVPGGPTVVVLVGFLALANSDADSQLLTVASTVTHDLLPYLDVDLTAAGHVVADRIAFIGTGLLMVLAAGVAPDLVALLRGVGTLFTILGVVVIATLFWDGTTDLAVFGGLGGGLVSAVGVILRTGTVRFAPVVALVVTTAVVLLGSLSGDYFTGGSP